jgi:predicted aminopeptidase
MPHNRRNKGTKKQRQRVGNSIRQPQKPVRKRIGRLKTAKDVTRYIARCIKKAEQGGDSTAYYRQTVMASILLKAIETATFEERIARIEQAIQNQMEKQNELRGASIESGSGPSNRDASEFE